MTANAADAGESFMQNAGEMNHYLNRTLKETHHSPSLTHRQDGPKPAVTKDSFYFSYTYFLFPYGEKNS